MEKYIPISCSSYDELEAIATLQKTVVIRYLDEENVISERSIQIRQLYTRSKIEYLLTADAVEIRLDKIISADGKNIEGGGCVWPPHSQDI